MTKIIKAPNSEVYDIKALIPYWDEFTDQTEESSPYRVISIRPDMNLHEFAISVLDAFDFHCDHMFGFYDNLKTHFGSKVSYELPAMIHEEKEIWGQTITKKTYNLEKYTPRDLFTRRGKKWLMLFDYGDEWQFWLTLKDKRTVIPNKQYPQVIESKYAAPEQYQVCSNSNY